jgi:hypothetical protein
LNPIIHTFFSSFQLGRSMIVQGRPDLGTLGRLLFKHGQHGSVSETEKHGYRLTLSKLTCESHHSTFRPFQDHFRPIPTMATIMLPHFVKSSVHFLRRDRVSRAEDMKELSEGLHNRGMCFLAKFQRSSDGYIIRYITCLLI